MARRIALLFCLLAGLAASAIASPVSDQQVAVENVLKLVDRGVSDQIIIRHIQARRYVFDLTTEDILMLRDRGVSEAVLAAMLDTALPAEPVAVEEEVVAPLASVADDDYGTESEDSDQVVVDLSPGYVSPWYHYPYAWGYYYDPFPAWYSSFYYPPFSFSIGWGWYGGCDYWYAGCWPYYWWNDPYCYDYAYGHSGCYVPAPYDGNAYPWESGRGMGNDRRPPPGRQVNATESMRRAASQVAPRNATRAPQLEQRSGRSRVHVRTPGRDAVPAAAPASRGRGSTPASRPASAPRYSAPRSGRGSTPAAAPRSAPHYESSPRGSTPAPAPRSAAPSSGSTLRAAPAVRVAPSGSWSRSAAPAARGGASAAARPHR